MPLETAKIVADEIRSSRIFGQYTVEIVRDHPTLEDYAVKVRDGTSLVAKYDGKKQR